MTTAVGCGAERLRDIRGECCDLCGDVCHPDAEICVAISCARCDSLIYHQGCVEKYLKKHGLESNRKTGFPCPRGRGKGTRSPDECKGRVDKSHPIIPRNEEKKKKSFAPPITEVLAKQVKAKPDPKTKQQQQQAKPPAIPRKAKTIAQQAAATVLRSSAPIRTPTPPAANVWHQAAVSSAVWEAPTPVDPAAAVAAAAAAADLEKPKGPHVPVGLVLEEALTKAQKKNLQRRKKKQQQDDAGGDGHSEAGTAATDASSIDGWNNGGGGSNGGASSRLGTTAGAAALLSSNSFITDIKRYQQLLGLYVGDDDSDDEDADLSDVSDDSASDVSSTAAPVALTRPGSSSSYFNASTPAAPAAAADAGSGGSAAVSDADDAALAAIMEQSRREYELQQEMQRQREFLSGYGAGCVIGSSVEESHEHAASHPVVLPTFSVPLAQPVVVPTSVPVAVPLVDSEPAVTHSFAGLAYQQQSTLPLWQQEMAMKSSAVDIAAGFGGYGVQQAAAFVVVPMAAGHGMAAAAGDDDDDLDSLLALCGVAG